MFIKKYLKKVLLFFLFIFLTALFIITAPQNMSASYRVIKDKSSYILIRCSNNRYEKLIRIHSNWYWRGKKYNSWQDAAQAACGGN